MKADFPEWAEAFDARFDRKISTGLNELKENLKKELTSEMPKPVEDLDMRLLSIVKPRWRETIMTQEWKDWLAAQPPEKAALVNSDKAEDAIALLSAFEEATKSAKTASEIASDRKQRMKAAVLPQGEKATPVKSEADMSLAELRASIGREVFTE